MTEARRIAFLAGTGLFAGLGFLLLGVLVSGGGIVIGALALPILMGAWALASGRHCARPLAVALALVYAAVVGYVATTPWRGLAPLPGQAREPLDPLMVGITMAFVLAALLLLVGTRARSAESWTP
jgi:hypothetical protein